MAFSPGNCVGNCRTNYVSWLLEVWKQQLSNKLSDFMDEGNQQYLKQDYTASSSNNKKLHVCMYVLCMLPF